MSLLKDLGLGVSTYSKALNIIFNKGLAWFFIFPLLFNLIILWGGLELIDTLINYSNNYILNLTKLQNTDFLGSSILKSISSGVIWVILKILFYFIYIYVGGYLVLIVMSPILSILSEKVDKILTNKIYPFSAEQTMRDVVRGVILALRNLFIELLIIFSLFMIGLLPIIGWLSSLLSPFILFIVSSYFYGFSFLDYSNERNKRNIKQSVILIKQHKGMAIGNGLIFSIVLLIPIIGTFLAGFVAVISVVAATISMNRINNIL